MSTSESSPVNAQPTIGVTANTRDVERGSSSLDDYVLPPGSETIPGSGPSQTHGTHVFSGTNDGYVLRERYGRTFNSLSDAYALPADAQESARLNVQHSLLKLKLKGLYFKAEVVDRVLAQGDGGVQPTVVDIGTGSGIWAIDLAEQFPHVQVVGVDLAPVITNASTIPPNVRFECRDFNMMLQEYKSSLDVVHQRCSFPGAKDPEGFLNTVHDALRPGGIYLSIEGDLKTRDENRSIITQFNEGLPGFSYYAKATHAFEIASQKRCSLDACWRIPTMLSMMGDKWTGTGQIDLYVPLGIWQSDLTTREQQIAEYMRQDALGLLEAFRPAILQEGGSSPEAIDMLINNAKDEITNLSTKLYIRFQGAWAVKR